MSFAAAPGVVSASAEFFHVTNKYIVDTPATSLGYLDFEFNISGHTDYGWVSLSVTDISITQFSVTLNQIAYDLSGAPLPSGDTGATIPEPASAALLALGLLVTGAAATRRFRRDV